MTISWRESLSVGLADIDSDHKALFTLAGAMARAIGLGDMAGMGLAMRTLVGGLSEHFSREERILQARGDSRLEPHRASHDDALERLFLLHHRFMMMETPDGKYAIIEEAHGFFVQWLENHTATEDADLRPLSTSEADLSPILVPPARDPEASAGESGASAGDGDIGYTLPPHLAHLLRRVEYHIPRPAPAASGFDSFDSLCAAAIRRRTDSVLLFFQRSNPALSRGLPPPFIASAEFAGRFAEAVERLIVPAMLASRQLRQLANQMDLRKTTAASFWDAVDRPITEDMAARWKGAWDDLLLRERERDDGVRVLQVKPATRQLREILSPSSPQAYDLARIGNVEIRAFRSLFDPSRDLTVGLEAAWRSCQDLYEQELEPRVFQQRARDGALRDYLLSVHGKFSDHWGEFLILTCHRAFARVTTRYLERLSLSLGRTAEERVSHMPFLIGYLAQLAGHPHIRRAERDGEDRWQSERRELQKVLRGVAPVSC